MRWLLGLFLAINFLSTSFAAKAQDVLDRVDPTRIEDRKVEQIENRSVDRPATQITTQEHVRSPNGIRVGAIEIVGLSQLTNAYFSDIIQSFIGQTLSSDQVGDLVERLASRARTRFPLASARIVPQQIVAGIIKVEIDEGSVDAIELKGFQNRSLRSVLQHLVTGKPVTKAQLERALLLARDIDGVTVRDSQIRRDDSRNILVINGFYNRLRAQITVDNDSTKPIGPFETLGFAQANGLLSHHDSLQAFVLTALPQVEELTFLRLRYASRVDDDGTELSIAGSVSGSKPGSYLAPLDIVGKSRWASVGFSRPIDRKMAASLWLDGSLSFRELEQNRAGTGSRRDRLTVARMRLLGSAKFAGGVVQASATLSQGLDILNATALGDARASRADAGVGFTTLQLFGQWSRPIAGPFEISIAARTQIADRPLLVSEEIGLGGARFARGYDYSERTGDEGAMGVLELSYKHDRQIGPLAGAEAYAFVDGGRVTNLREGTGGGALMSTGAGIRFDVNRKTDATLEFALPLSGDRFESDSGSPRVRFSLTRYF